MQEKGGCSYRTNERGSLVLHDAALFEIHDIEDVVRRAKAVHACAYYTARDALKSAQVVVLPYSLLLHEKTRDALGIDLEGHVVVCDEAHNVIDAVADMHSCVITRAQLDQAHAELQMYITKVRLSSLRACVRARVRSRASINRGGLTRTGRGCSTENGWAATTRRR